MQDRARDKNYATLVHLLHERAQRRGDQRVYTYLADGDLDEQHLSYADLDRRARGIAAHISERVRPGDRVVLIYQSDLHFVSAFFGCLYAGAVAVPGYPPRFHQSLPDQNLARLSAMVADCAPALLLTTTAIAARMTDMLPSLPQFQGMPVVATDALGDSAEAPWTMPAIDPSKLAFLQYTSGSTGDPKGAMITHGNLINNERQIEWTFRLTPETVAVGWLPLHHDMGLIAMLLGPLYSGGRCVFLSPVNFVQRPMRWLHAITRHRGTYALSPDFGYRLAVRVHKPEDLERIDLSSVRSALNGAEPVRADTLREFQAVFGRCGFRPEAYYPCYGMAEASVLVSGWHKNEPPRLFHASAAGLERDELRHVPAGDPDERVFVGCGIPPDDLDVAIVDPQSLQRSTSERVGEIWIAGPNVASGYWNKESINKEQFRAHTATGEGPYYRTGDLGFLHEGMLYITGRLKDLIIIEGRNHYPQDIERTVEAAYPSFRLGGGAAFSMEYEGIERLVVVQELERRVREVDNVEAALAVRRAVSQAHEIVPREVVFLKAGGLPKTSSGKVQRRACRLALKRGELQVVGRVAYEDA
jgi:acyl-CoA synthetase (AMP-forming)/AMP-acid ligase II